MIRYLLLMFGMLHLETASVEDEDDEPDETDGDEGATEEEVRDRRAKELSGEAKKWRHKLRTAEARIVELESDQANEAHTAALVENAFLRSAIARGNDLDIDTAFDLMRVRGFLDAV